MCVLCVCVLRVVVWNSLKNLNLNPLWSQNDFRFQLSFHEERPSPSKISPPQEIPSPELLSLQGVPSLIEGYKYICMDVLGTIALGGLLGRLGGVLYIWVES